MWEYQRANKRGTKGWEYIHTGSNAARKDKYHMLLLYMQRKRGTYSMRTRAQMYLVCIINATSTNT